MSDEKQYFKEIRILEKRYYNIISNFDLNFPKALNLQEEKTKFLNVLNDDKIYNPKFIFEKKEFDEKKIQTLKQFKIDTKNDLYGFKKLMKQRLKTKIYEIECHKNWGKPISSKYVIKYRGKPSRYLLAKAKLYCRRYQREKIRFKTLTPQIAAKRLANEVFRLTGNKTEIEFTNQMASKVNISPHANLIKINPDERFTSYDIKRLKVHEIGTHYMRYYNGHQFNIKILESGTSNYIETEEGLATYIEELKGFSSNAQMFIYAGRVIATFYARKLSFYEIFQLLKHYGFRNDAAFSITYRAKRNLSDTSQKGGFTKDYVYFSGYFKIRRFAKHHDIKDLFIGKIKIEDIKILKKFIKKNRDNIKTILENS